VRHQRRLDLERPDPVAGRDDQVVVASLLPEIAVLVGADDVARRPPLAGERLTVEVAAEEGRATGNPREALALIVPSVCFETFGIILIEAFRQGTPVVARRLGPFPEIVDAAGGGELFETEQELVEALRRSLAGGTRRRQLGERGRNAFHRHWCERVVVPQYLDIVARAARKRGNEELAARAWATGADTE
jgi:hypothetical protein